MLQRGHRRPSRRVPLGQALGEGHDLARTPGTKHSVPLSAHHQPMPRGQTGPSCPTWEKAGPTHFLAHFKPLVRTVKILTGQPQRETDHNAEGSSACPGRGAAAGPGRPVLYPAGGHVSASQGCSQYHMDRSSQARGMECSAGQCQGQVTAPLGRGRDTPAPSQRCVPLP